MTELHFNINPARSLGDIPLGLTLNNTLSLLSPSQIATKLLFNKDKISESPLIVKLVKYDIQLVFEPKSQRLVLIDVGVGPLITNEGAFKQRNNLGLIYQESLIKDWGFAKLYNDVFGPTQRGKAYDGGCSYVLDYPGLSLSFDTQLLNKDNGEDLFSELLTSSHGKSQISCDRIFIHQYATYDEFVESQTIPGTAKAIAKPHLSNDIEISNITISKSNNITTLKIKFLKHPDRHTFSSELKLHQSNQQDILMLLGPPDEVFAKKSSKLNIHNAKSSQASRHGNSNAKDSKYSQTQSNDVDFLFHNYFRYGFDLLYDHSSQTSLSLETPGVLAKVIFHTNLPISLSFGKYEKSAFEFKGDKLSVCSSSEFDEIKKFFAKKQQQRHSSQEDDVVYDSEDEDQYSYHQEVIEDPIIIMRDPREVNLSQSIELLDHEHDTEDISATYHNVEDVKAKSTTSWQQKSEVYVVEDERLIWEVLEGKFVESLTLF